MHPRFATAYLTPWRGSALASWASGRTYYADAPGPTIA
jgi:hypothetical protein